jgi:hypothetical protein
MYIAVSMVKKYTPRCGTPSYKLWGGLGRDNSILERERLYMEYIGKN